MITLDRGLIARTERYIASHDLCDQYAVQLRKRIASFVSFLEQNGFSDALIEPNAITEQVNSWLLSLRPHISPYTLDGYRRAFLAVWNNAENPDVDHPPLRLRKIKKPRAIVRAFTHDEIKALLHVADHLKGRHPDENLRRDYWCGVISAGYSTGLRRGDLITIKWSAVQADGRARVIQHKTGYAVDVRFCDEAMTRARRLNHTGGLMFPWPYHLTVFARTFARIATLAKIDGSFKFLRRSAGSYAESIQPGSGSRLLGHRCEKVFRLHYEDPSISQPGEITPPPIK